MKNRTMFLLEVNVDNLGTDVVPEITLWEHFGDALAAALDAVEAEMHDALDITETEVIESLELIGDHAFLPGMFKIMPITVSKPGSITWFGKPRKNKEER